MIWRGQERTSGIFGWSGLRLDWWLRLVKLWGNEMIRALMAIAGILLSGPTLIFFWIGTQTFTRIHERLLAVALTIAAGALLALSLGLIFTPTAQRLQSVLLGTTLFLLAIVFVIYRFSK